MKSILTKKLIKKKIYIYWKIRYVAVFDYRDKILTVLSSTSGGVCIISSVSVVGAPVEIAGASFILISSLTTGIIKKLLSITRNKQTKTIKFLCWLKGN